MEYKDYYAVLGVPRTASRPRSRRPSASSPAQHHPDAKPVTRPPSGASRRSTRPTRSCPIRTKRKQYDQLGANWELQPAGARRCRRRGRRPVRRLRGAARARRRPLRVPHDRRRRRVLRFLPRVLRRGGGRLRRDAAAGPRPGRGRPADPRSRTSSAGMGLDAGATGSAPAPTGRPAGTRCRPRRRGASPRSRLEEAYHGTKRLVDVDGKRLEVTIPPGADTRDRGSG